jgi:murein DD-endopeptidase MepM/ murein hydrolase activator NlpD
MNRIITYLNKIRKLSLTKKVSLVLAIFFLYLLLKNIIQSYRKTGEQPSEYPFKPIVLPVMEMRNDTLGFGHFGASRSGGTRSHDGVDIITYKGQLVFAPFDGKITREIQAYSNDTKYRGVEIVSLDQVYKMKIMYCKPAENIVGYGVKQGDVIAFSQDISEKYSSLMKPHLHIELYENAEKIDPQTHFYIK